MSRDVEMRRLLQTQSVLRLIAAIGFSLLLTAGAACTSAPVGPVGPSEYVPIPPPTFGAPSPEIDSAGVTHTYWKVTGQPSADLRDLWVYITNIDMGAGTIVRSATDGSYATRVEGQQDNRILFSFGAPNGPTMCASLREGPANVPCQ
jgi:hypothetical protein